VITMKKAPLKAGALLALLALVLAASAGAQVPPPKPAGPPPPPLLKVFLDWPGADIEFLRAEIPFVEFVPALDIAQVQVAVTPEGKPGAESFRIEFSGLGEFQGETNSLPYVPDQVAKPEDVRRGIAGMIKIGLLRYVAKTPLAKDLSIRFLDQAKPTAVNDPWHFWVFSLSANAFLMGETQYTSRDTYGSFSASRVTPQFKIRTSVYGNSSNYRFDLGDGTLYEGKTSGYGFSGLVVKSLGEHWSAGAFFSVASSTYANVKLSGDFGPALEYDIFPYSESTKRQLRILYRIGFTAARYYEETVYFKTAESLLQEALSFAYEVVRPWGKASVQLKGSHFFHNVKFNRLELEGGLEFRVWRGLNFEIDGSYTRIRDQLTLSAEGASYEDILLRQKLLATGYDYSFSVGLNFSFGSTKSNVVNPRFGNGGRSISISM
jgi:hypothetical protein